MSEPAPIDPLSDARAQAVRRILELRGERPAPDTGDLRALLSRVELRAGETSAAARDLSAVLPTRVEAAVERVVAENAAGVGRRLDAVHASTEETADAIARIEADLVAERLARIEDLEALIELIATGVSAIRADVARLNERISDLTEARTDQGGAAPESEPTQPPAGRHAYRSLFARTEHAAHGSPEPAAEQSA
jgi:septal ring factor EnvC (AmiA/AmiB activator)